MNSVHERSDKEWGGDVKTFDDNFSFEYIPSTHSQEYEDRMFEDLSISLSVNHLPGVKEMFDESLSNICLPDAIPETAQNLLNSTWNEACNLTQILGQDRKEALEKSLEDYISKVSAIKLDADKKDVDDGKRRYD